MTKHLKTFLLRGMAFAGFGPVIFGIVILCISYSVEGLSLGAAEVLIGIVSTYLLAFVQAGASVFNQIEEWPITKSLLFHFTSVYLAYVVCYLVNSWIPFEPIVILIFTLAFTALYFVIWFTVYFAVKSTERRLNMAIDKAKEG